MGQDFAFVKRQCMHCLDPACVDRLSVRRAEEERVGCGHMEQFALHRVPLLRGGLPVRRAKVRMGQVESQDRQVRVLLRPTLEEESAACVHRGLPHGSSDFRQTRRTCWPRPRNASRHAPDKYFENRVYGEHEAGGTQVLYLSHVAFEKIGLPKLGSTSLGHYATKVTSVIYKWLSAPILMAGTPGRGDQAELEPP